MKEAAKAEATYDDAIASGHGAYLLTKNPDKSTFNMSSNKILSDRPQFHFSATFIMIDVALPSVLYADAYVSSCSWKSSSRNGMYCSFIATRFTNEKTTWEMIVSKARKWLKREAEAEADFPKDFDWEAIASRVLHKR